MTPEPKKMAVLSNGYLRLLFPGMGTKRDALINGPDYDPYKGVIFPGMDPHIMIVMRYF